MKRVLEPEILDHLSPDDPRAIASRSDLRRLNSLMGHFDRMQKYFLEAFPKTPPQRIIEIGAGDGTFMLKLIQRMGWNRTEIFLLDRQPAITRETAAALSATGCKIQLVQADVFTWLPNAPKADAIMANLFLHHFSEDALTRLFKLASEASNVFLAGEPRRYPPSLIVSSCLGLIGCNATTRHDAVLSVRAGFNRQELSALWSDKTWRLKEEPSHSSHWFLAQKK